MGFADRSIQEGELSHEDHAVRPTRGRLLLVGAAACWSLNGVIIKLAYMGGLNIAFYRSLVAALCFLPLAWTRRQRLDRANPLIALAYLGAVTLFVLATKATTAANAIFLQYTAPVFVFLLGAAFLDERPERRDWLGLAVTMAGVVYIAVGAGSADALGVGFGLASGLSFGLLIVLLRRFRDRDPFWVLFCNNLVVALLLFPWVRQEVWISPRDLGLMLLMGSVQLGLAYLLFSLAMRHVSAREGSLITLLEPLLNPIWVALVVGEIPGAYTLVGGAVILAGLGVRYAWAPRQAG